MVTLLLIHCELVSRPILWLRMIAVDIMVYSDFGHEVIRACWSILDAISLSQNIGAHNGPTFTSTLYRPTECYIVLRV